MEMLSKAESHYFDFRYINSKTCIHSLVNSVIHSFIHSFSHLYIHTFLSPFIHPFTKSTSIQSIIYSMYSPLLYFSLFHCRFSFTRLSPSLTPLLSSSSPSLLFSRAHSFPQTLSESYHHIWGSVYLTP